MKKTFTIIAILLLVLVSASCSNKQSDNLTMNMHRIDISIGESSLLIVDGAESYSIIWSSHDEFVATVQDGIVTGIAKGKTTIIAQVGKKSFLCSVTVSDFNGEDEISVFLNRTSALLAENSCISLEATTKKNGTPTIMDISWSTSDESVAIVENGVITALREGKATIKVTAGLASASCIVTVDNQLKKLRLDVNTAKLFIGDVMEIGVQVTSAGIPVASSSVVWSSSNADVASVENGIVTALSEGSAIILATDGELQSSCSVFVSKKQPNILSLDKRAMGQITVPSKDSVGKTLSAGDTVTAVLKVTPSFTEIDALDTTIRIAVNGDQPENYLCGAGATLSEYNDAADLLNPLEITVDLVIQDVGEKILLRSQGESKWEYTMSTQGFAFLFWGAAGGEKISIELLSVTLVEPPLGVLHLAKRATGQIAVSNVDSNGEALVAGDTVTAVLKISSSFNQIDADDTTIRIAVNGDQPDNYLCGVGATLSEYNDAADLLDSFEITVDLVIQAKDATILLRSQSGMLYNHTMTENGFAFIFWGTANGNTITIELVSVTFKSQ